jgi:DNA-binding IclR family transcriptional regulator
MSTTGAARKSAPMAKPNNGGSGDSKGTVVRVVQLLRCFAESPEWTLTDIAKCVELPRSTTHRLLQLLRSQGLVEVDEVNRRYLAGTELHRIAGLLAARMPLVQIGTPILRSIVNECDETALLSVYQPSRRNMIFAAKVDSTQPVRYMIDVNVPHTVLWGATGRAILAFLDEDDVERVVASNTEPSAEGDLRIDRKKLREELAKIRRDGYASSRGQRISGAVGIAAPFFNASGAVAGDVGLTIPEYRFNNRLRSRYIALVRDGAAKISAALGHRPGQERSANAQRPAKAAQ